MDTWDTQLRKGVVELAVLAVLCREEAYGYRIVERLRARPALEFTESTVYPVLTRLAREGMLAVRNEPSPSGPPRRYYRLTPAGRDRLRHMSGQWNVLSRSVASLLAPNSEPAPSPPHVEGAK